MKWKAKIYEHHETRKIKVFALFPTRVNDYIVWLEHYWVEEQHQGHGTNLWTRVKEWTKEQES